MSQTAPSADARPDVVDLSARVGLAPSEWSELVGDPVEPPTPGEWREAILSTVEEL